MTTLLQEAFAEAASCPDDEQDFQATQMLEQIQYFCQQNIHFASSKIVLDELLSGVTDANMHEKISTGPPSGKEIW